MLVKPKLQIRARLIMLGKSYIALSAATGIAYSRIARGLRGYQEFEYQEKDRIESVLAAWETDLREQDNHAI